MVPETPAATGANSTERVVTLTFRDAVNLALDHALADDPKTLVFGEDVAAPGGIFGCTRGLQERYGTRVFDTPISESAILGAAVGSSMMGLRPVVEIMWVDFALVALDQLVNQAANVRYVSRGRLSAPLTVRTQQGMLPGSCAQHSQSLEAIFTHIPGLRVAVPSTPQDAYSLLRAAIADDDPAIVIEHRALYTTLSGDVLTGDDAEPIGGAKVTREGTDVTLIAWGTSYTDAETATRELADDGASVELINPRWLAPLDMETIALSVQKTGRLVVAHEANIVGGFGGEIAARVGSECFWSLEAPIERVGLPNTRVPAAPALQAALKPGVADIKAAVRRSLDG